MAIWLTKQRGTTGPVFGSADRFEGLGVFIDTYKNQRPGVVFPYVMAMVGNASVTYDKDHDGASNEIAGCSVRSSSKTLDPLHHLHEHCITNIIKQARGIRTSSNPTKIRLTYFQEKSLKVDLMYKSENEWTECFETGPLTLPSVAYLGFSAETGELSDNHDIISVTTSNKYINKGYNEQGTLTPADNGKGKAHGKQFNLQKETGSWKWFFFKVVVFFGVVVGGYVGWTMYRANQRGRF